MLCPSVGKSATTVSSLWTSLSVPREKPDSTRPWRVWLWSSFKPSLNYVRVEHRLSCIRRELLVLYYLTIVKIENEEKNAENEDEVAEVAAVTGQSSASKSILKRPVSTDPSSRPPPAFTMRPSPPPPTLRGQRLASAPPPEADATRPWPGASVRWAIPIPTQRTGHESRSNTWRW